jgi:hypothetical protein
MFGVKYQFYFLIGNYTTITISADNKKEAMRILENDLGKEIFDKLYIRKWWKEKI